MKYYNLGEINWKQTQLIYHALAQLEMEGLVLDSPDSRYVSLGLHQDPRDEIDFEYCKDNDIGIFRREIGGGTVLLDSRQVFFNLILKRNRDGVSRVAENFFRKFLRPVTRALKELGMDAEYRPICDLVINEKKISGNGGGEIGYCRVLAGGIMLDFDREMMARALKCSGPLKQMYIEHMKINLTTVREELGYIPPKEKICSLLIEKSSELLGPMTEGTIDAAVFEKMKELDQHYSSDRWMYQRGVKQLGREIKVKEGVYLFYHAFAIPGGETGITFEISEERIEKISFDEPHNFHPILRNEMEKKIIGLNYDSRKIIDIVCTMIEKNNN